MSLPSINIPGLIITAKVKPISRLRYPDKLKYFCEIRRSHYESLQRGTHTHTDMILDFPRGFLRVSDLSVLIICSKLTISNCPGP